MKILKNIKKFNANSENQFLNCILKTPNLKVMFYG